MFINPPYSQMKAWAECIAARAGVRREMIVLLPARTDTGWWHTLVAARPHAICFWTGRITFNRPDGTPGQSAPFPSALLYWGCDDATFARAWQDECTALARAAEAAASGLDDTSLDQAAIERQIRLGGAGMPPFEGQLSDEQIQALAEYDARGGQEFLEVYGFSPSDDYPLVHEGRVFLTTAEQHLRCARFSIGDGTGR